MLDTVRPAAFAAARLPRREDALVYYDRPLAYVAADTSGTPHLVVIADWSEAWETWMCAPLRAPLPPGPLDTPAVFAGSPGPFHAYRFTPAGELVETHVGARDAIPASWWALLGGPD